MQEMRDGWNNRPCDEDVPHGGGSPVLFGWKRHNEALRSLEEQLLELSSSVLYISIELNIVSFDINSAAAVFFFF